VANNMLAKKYAKKITFGFFVSVLIPIIFFIMIDYLRYWKAVMLLSSLIVLHLPSIYKILKGQTVSIPSYYYTVDASSTRGFKFLAIGLLVLPIYSILIVTYIYL
jgi:hypothetical protein